MVTAQCKYSLEGKINFFFHRQLLSVKNLLAPSLAPPRNWSCEPQVDWSQTVKCRHDCCSWAGVTSKTNKCFHWGQSSFFTTGDFCFNSAWSERIRQLFPPPPKKINKMQVQQVYWSKQYFSIRKQNDCSTLSRVLWFALNSLSTR